MNPNDSHPRSTFTSHLTWWLALLTLTSLAGLHAYYYLPFIADDALISLRYAERLLSGDGLTWTSGEAVEGYSNLTWTLGAAFLGLLGIDLITATRILGIGALSITLWSISQVATRRERSIPSPSVLPFFLGGLVYITSPPVGVWSIGGLEATLFAGATLGYFVGGAPYLSRHGLERSPHRSAPYWGALLCLTRPDGLLFITVWAIVFAVTHMIFHRKYKIDLADTDRSDEFTAMSQGEDPPTLWARLSAGLPMILIPALAAVGQLIFRVIYYGDWVPNTAHLKVAISERILGWGLDYWGSVFMVLWPVLLISLLALRSPHRGLVSLLFTSLIVWVAYIASVGGDIFPGHRHAVVCCGLMACLMTLGAQTLNTRHARLILVVLCVSAMGYTQWISAHSRDYRRVHLERWEWDGQVIGAWLNAAFADQDPLLAVTAAGTLPFFSKLRALDMQGLNDRHIASQPAQSGYLLAHDHGDGAYVLSKRPDLIAFRGVGRGKPVFVSGDQMKRTAEFNIRYRLRTFEGQYPHWVKSQLFVRLDGPLGVQAESKDQIWIPSYLFKGGVTLPSPPERASSKVKQDMADATTAQPHQAHPSSGTLSRWPIGELIRLNNFPLAAGRWHIETDPPLPIKLRVFGRAPTRGGSSLTFHVLGSSRELDLPPPSSYRATHEVLVRGVKLTRVADAPTPVFEVSPSMLEAIRHYEEQQASVKPSTMILEDFERAEPSSKNIKWQTSGSALTQITRGHVKHQRAVTQYGGQALLNSFHPRDRDRPVGRRWSQPIQLTHHPILSFKLGGGSIKKRVGLRLWINGVAVSTWAGDNRESLSQYHLDLRAYPEAVIQLEIIDEASKSWGHILADDFWLSTDLESALTRAQP